MKRAGDLWSHVLSFENLHRAAYQVLRRKRGQTAAGAFFFELEGTLLQLQRELASGGYEPAGYRTFWIAEPKPRLISAASFRDRVVHHALVNVIEPVFERRFIHDSYACRRGKGTHAALDRFIRWGRSTNYVLKMDIRKYFPSIDHVVLKETIRGTIKDREVLSLCDLIIDCSNDQEPVVQHFPGDDLLAPLSRRRGLPIGNLTSQFFANVFLDVLDHHVKDVLRVRRYLRYVDDFCLFHDEKAYLTDIRAELADYLLRLRLRLNEGKSRVRQLKEGVEFLGFVILPDRIRLNARSVRRQRERMGKLARAYARHDVRWAEVASSLQAWSAHAEHGDTWRLRGDVFNGTVFCRGKAVRSIRPAV